MTKTTQILTPMSEGDAVELSGGLWRKQILPMRKVNYRGRVLDFSRKYLAEIADSFQRKAFDQVPAQLANDKNEHNNNPRNTVGELADVELAADGLYGYFRPDEDGARILAKNPKLGVSARIFEGYTRENDKQYFPKALQHVLLTVNPHVSGMKPWERVELSAEPSADEVLDLSQASYEEEDMTQSTTKPDETEGGGKVTLELSADDAALFQKMLADQKAVLEFTESLEADDLETEDEDGDKGDTDDKGPDDVVLATLDTQGKQIIELTNQLREKDIAREVDRLAASGLAPAIIEAAKPLLSLGEATIELSNGDSIEPATAARDLLNTLVELANQGLGFVTFDEEIGLSSDENDPVLKQRNALLDAWETATPSH
jgi:hypothetical protein